MNTLLQNIRLDLSSKKYQTVFERLKPHIKSKIIEYLDNLKNNNRGRKRSFDLDVFLDCLFFMSDNGLKTFNIKKIFGIAKSTFYHYYMLVSTGDLLEKIHAEIVKEYVRTVPSPDFLITDTFTVKSMNGSEGLGRNPTDRGRKGLKVSLICDQNLVTHAVSLSPANCHDSKILEETISSSITNIKGIKCLADSGYSGHKYLSKIRKTTGLNLVSKPMRTRDHSKMSHTVSETDHILLEKKRNYIERLNGNIRNFRGLMVKYTKNISTYKTLLFVSLLCITCYMIVISS
jgi:hypothetical protein